MFWLRIDLLRLREPKERNYKYIKGTETAFITRHASFRNTPSYWQQQSKSKNVFENKNLRIVEFLKKKSPFDCNGMK